MKAAGALLVLPVLCLALIACGGPPDATATPVLPVAPTAVSDAPTATAVSLPPTTAPATSPPNVLPATAVTGPTFPVQAAPPTPAPATPTAPASPTPPFVVVIMPTTTPPKALSSPTYRPAPAPSRTVTPVPTGDATVPTAPPLDTPEIVVSTPAPPATPTHSGVATQTAASAPVPRSAVPLVVIDPGHGGTEPGAASDSGLIEKDVNLRIALAVAARLRAAGVRMILTRSADTGVNVPPRDVNGNGVIDVDDDLQARVDLANASGAWALVSIHNNAQPGDARAEGTTTYYCDLGSQPVASLALAQSLQTHVLEAIHAAGYPAADRHVRDDAELRKPGGHLYLLGPHNPRITRPSAMPGALVETLFLSNAADAAQLANPAMLDAIAGGFVSGITAYLDTVPR